MRSVAATYKDVADQLRIDLESLTYVCAAFLTITLKPVKVHVWTLVPRPAMEVEERALTRAEFRLIQVFPDVHFDFTTIELEGRDPVQFIPQGAIPIIIRDAAIRKHFEESMFAEHARA